MLMVRGKRTINYTFTLNIKIKTHYMKQNKNNSVAKFNKLDKMKILTEVISLNAP